MFNAFSVKPLAAESLVYITIIVEHPSVLDFNAFSIFPECHEQFFFIFMSTNACPGLYLICASKLKTYLDGARQSWESAWLRLNWKKGEKCPGPILAPAFQ